MSNKTTTPQQHMMLEAHWPNDCCLCRLEYENAILRLGLEEAKAHCRNHHLEACETCAANESEIIALRKQLKEDRKRMEAFWMGLEKNP